MEELKPFVLKTKKQAVYGDTCLQSQQLEVEAGGLYYYDSLFKIKSNFMTLW
jgi:hypothetical protein